MSTESRSDSASSALSSNQSSISIVDSLHAPCREAIEAQRDDLRKCRDEIERLTRERDRLQLHWDAGWRERADCYYDALHRIAYGRQASGHAVDAQAVAIEALSRFTQTGSPLTGLTQDETADELARTVELNYLRSTVEGNWPQFGWDRQNEHVRKAWTDAERKRRAALEPAGEPRCTCKQGTFEKYGEYAGHTMGAATMPAADPQCPVHGGSMMLRNAPGEPNGSK